MKAILKIDNKEIEVFISDEQLWKLKKKSPFERAAEYFRIETFGGVRKYYDISGQSELCDYSVANYCTDKNLIQQQAWRETLNRLLWRWQYENDEPVDWGFFNRDAYCIFKSGINNFVVCPNYHKQQGTIYFATKEKAYQAIEEVVKPFMAEHPDFVW